jgi:hypothetical protein
MDAIQTTDTPPDDWQGYCRSCGYLLRGLPAPRCPECGRTFDRNNPRTYLKNPKRPFRKWARRAAMLLLLLATAYAAEIGWLYWGWKAEQPAVALWKNYGIVVTSSIGPEWMAGTLRPQDRWLLERVSDLSLYLIKLPDKDLAEVGRFKHLERLLIQCDELTDAGLGHLARLRNMRTLSLQSTSITDAGLAHLNGMQKLEELSLLATQVKGPGLAHLRRMPRLSALDLDGAPLNPKFLEEFKGLPALTGLGLGHTALEDEALEHLVPLYRLDVLNLTGINITDRGLKILARMNGLKLLYLYDNTVSRPALAELQKALPQTTIDADYPLDPNEPPRAPPN